MDRTSSPLKASDFGWGAFASEVIEYQGKFYWFAFSANALKFGEAIGLAVTDAPIGPFQDAIEKALIKLDMLPATDNEKANPDPFYSN